MRVIFDGHLDLAWSAVSMNRDLNEPIGLIRSREQGMTDQQGRGNATVSLPTMREGGVMMCLPTVLARARRAEASFRLEIATTRLCGFFWKAAMCCPETQPAPWTSTPSCSSIIVGSRSP